MCVQESPPEGAAAAKDEDDMTEEERIAALGKPRLGDLVTINVHIRESIEFKVHAHRRAVLTPSTPAVPNCSFFEGFSAIYWTNRPFLIFDILALWRSVLSARAPVCQKLKMVG